MRSKGTLWWPLRRTSLRGGVAFTSVGIESGCRRRNWAVAIRINYTWICLFPSWILFFSLLMISLVSLVLSVVLSVVFCWISTSFSSFAFLYLDCHYYTYTHRNICTTCPYIIYLSVLKLLPVHDFSPCIALLEIVIVFPLMNFTKHFSITYLSQTKGM